MVGLQILSCALCCAVFVRVFWFITEVPRPRLLLRKRDLQQRYYETTSSTPVAGLSLDWHVAQHCRFGGKCSVGSFLCVCACVFASCVYVMKSVRWDCGRLISHCGGARSCDAPPRPHLPIGFRPLLSVQPCEQDIRRHVDHYVDHVLE